MNLPQLLQEIEARLDAATPGPWKHMDTGFTGEAMEPQVWIQFEREKWGDCSIASVRRGCEEAGPHSQNIPDAKLIASCPTDMRKLIEIVKVLQEGLANARWCVRGGDCPEDVAREVDAATEQADRISRGE